MADDIQTFDSSLFTILVLADEFGAVLDTSCHDTDCDAGIGLAVPVVFLVGSSKDGSASCVVCKYKQVGRDEKTVLGVGGRINRGEKVNIPAARIII